MKQKVATIVESFVKHKSSRNPNNHFYRLLDIGM